MSKEVGQVSVSWIHTPTACSSGTEIGQYGVLVKIRPWLLRLWRCIFDHKQATCEQDRLRGAEARRCRVLVCSWEFDHRAHSSLGLLEIVNIAVYVCKLWLTLEMSSFNPKKFPILLFSSITKTSYHCWQQILFSETVSFEEWSSFSCIWSKLPQKTPSPEHTSLRFVGGRNHGVTSKFQKPININPNSNYIILSHVRFL